MKKEGTTPQQFLEKYLAGTRAVLERQVASLKFKESSSATPPVATTDEFFDYFLNLTFLLASAEELIAIRSAFESFEATHEDSKKEQHLEVWHDNVANEYTHYKQAIESFEAAKSLNFSQIYAILPVRIQLAETLKRIK